MSTQAYFPAIESERIGWLNNYSAKLPVQGVVCGLAAAEITATQAEIAAYLWVVQTWYPAMQREVQSATTLKNLLASGTGTNRLSLPALPSFSNPPVLCAPGVLPRVFNQVRRIKASPSYTEAIGRDLGIIGASDVGEYTVPDLSATVERGDGCQRVRLNYTKHGHDGVQIECRRNDGEWGFLAINVAKPYLDEQPLLAANTPEHREYRACYWDKGELVGEYSPVQRVTVGRRLFLTPIPPP